MDLSRVTQPVRSTVWTASQGDELLCPMEWLSLKDVWWSSSQMRKLELSQIKARPAYSRRKRWVDFLISCRVKVTPLCKRNKTNRQFIGEKHLTQPGPCTLLMIYIVQRAFTTRPNRSFYTKLLVYSSFSSLSKMLPHMWIMFYSLCKYFLHTFSH